MVLKALCQLQHCSRNHFEAGGKAQWRGTTRKNTPGIGKTATVGAGDLLLNCVHLVETRAQVSCFEGINESKEGSKGGQNVIRD
jgi:hypothetical protein